MGLLKRMLLSRNKVAYSILFREFFAKLLIPIDLLLRGSEKRKLQNSTDSSEPIILILGGSRSGTTLLYQTLTRYLNVSYIDNFIASFINSPISAYKLFHKLIRRPKKGFDNYFGSVKGFGGPNDAFFLWNRWLGEDRNHVSVEMSDKSKHEMKTFFNAWLQTTKKPFLNKNNRNSLCAPMLGEILPNMYFVEIYRNPVFVAQSLVLSRRIVQGSAKLGWGLLSKDSENTQDPLVYIDDICRQVQEVNQVIDQNRAAITSERYFRISYEEFCANPKRLVKEISSKVLDQQMDSEELEQLKFSTASNGQRLNDEEFNRIEKYFNVTHQ